MIAAPRYVDIAFNLTDRMVMHTHCVSIHTFLHGHTLYLDAHSLFACTESVWMHRVCVDGCMRRQDYVWSQYQGFYNGRKHHEEDLHR